MCDEVVSFAFLGPKGTYTHKAVIAFAENMGLGNYELIECVTFDDVFDAVDRGKATYGVVGKENSIEGPVTATLDNFAFRTSAVILAETVIDINHCLIAKEGTKIADIKVVASHQQGLAQCRRYLNEVLPGRSTQITSSTAESARIAAGSDEIAGIANEFAAELFGCEVVARDIQDNMHNQTAFALIGRPSTTTNLQSSIYKTSLALFMHTDRAGVLNMILSEFAFANINLTMIQSRPLKQQLGDYMFFIEFLGKDTDIDVQTALSCLRLKMREVKVLGSYPVIG